MKQFLKFTLASIVGIFITSLLGVLIFFIVLGAAASSGEKTTVLKSNSIYELDLEGSLVDRSEDNPFSNVLGKALGSSSENSLGLDEVLKNIEKAKNDDNIVGIYLKGGSLSGGIASVKEIRNALIDFKKSGKFIVAYADNYSQKMYYLVSVANKILINPQGMLELKGLSTETMFLKNTLDKLGIEMQIVKVGTFKSAVEPYILTKMSDANRLQVNVFLNSIWNTILKEISASRKIPTEKLNSYADEMMMYQPTEKSKQYNLVDSLVYADQVDSILQKYVKDFKKGDDLVFVKNSAMSKLPDNSKYDKNKVAVIYAIGEITDTEGDEIVARDMVKTINDVAKDSAVKAVVLRVSSPGGSAYASEQIWHALSMLKAKKPLIVSMGDYAASGGYYISCLADKIIAQPNTITGSIGIFGAIPNIKGLNEKLGLTYDGVKTNKMSDGISINRSFTPEERDLMQNYVNRGYELFVKRCAQGRKMKVEQIKAIAEGRVWTGEDAIKIGLVDKIGGLNDAIKLAVDKAKLSSYNLKEYPEKEDFTAKLLKSLTEDVEARVMEAQLGEQYSILKKIKSLDKINGIQARLPYDLNIR
ncbi:signal peptide peptidase A [Paludibacter propionicigenes WB4]|uniref:Signal peptide peptidase A n=1 Tax=Paludibacter propionicigenes (strain DSM 17365 / JCM 13257 / WB4) TaxID=694427 RepID=E4T6E1_PALPW|nr:signal peptide peptidase SppA [Paludibacter propionicigenes]ADQ80285.1 signal peptide peptidase A [Paludibacter propionicigenes WB4]